MSNTLSTEKPTDQPQREQDSRALPCSAVFVVVLVSYDWYRFQDNLGAALSIEGAREIAEKMATEKAYDGKLPIIEDSEESFNKDASEEQHIWIEVFEQNVRSMAA